MLLQQVYMLGIIFGSALSYGTYNMLCVRSISYIDCNQCHVLIILTNVNITLTNFTEHYIPAVLSTLHVSFTQSSQQSMIIIHIFVVVQLLSHVWLFVTPWTVAHQASLSFTLSLSLLKLTSIEAVMPSIHLILCCPLLLLPSVFPIIRVFSNESSLHISWTKYWSFSFTTSPSNEYSGLISFRIDWFAILIVQGILRSLLQHPSSKTSINSSALILIYALILTSIHDYWKNHSFDYTDLCQQSDVSAF